jgi:type IV pilus assembly protein PilO
MPENERNGLERFWEKLAGLSGSQKIIGAGGLLALVACFFVCVLFYPKYDEIRRLREGMSQMDIRLASAGMGWGTVVRHESELAKRKKRLDGLLKSLPGRHEAVSWMAELSRTGEKAGLEFLSFEPRPESRGEFYTQSPAAVRATGRFHQMTVFFESLSRAPRMALIQSLRLRPWEKSEKQGLLMASFVAAAARMNSMSPGKKRP